MNQTTDLTELEQFRQWADDIGHWQIVEAVDRWRKMTAPPADDAEENSDG